MDSITSLHARPKAWLANSVLAPHAATFASYLTHARYSAQSRGTYVASLAHLARWMSQCCLPLCQLDEAAVELFSHQAPAALRLSEASGAHAQCAARRVRPST